MNAGETNYILLPNDLLGGIFSRLPVKDLLRLRCVCRSWCALIDDFSFILTHHRAQYAIHKADGDVPLLIWYHDLACGDRCYLLSKHQGGDVLLNLISDVERDRNYVLTVDPNVIVKALCKGTANGIICFEIILFHKERSGYDLYEYRLGLWNPATRDFKIVAYPKAPDQRFPQGGHVVRGFMYDAMSNDFKILATSCIVCDPDSYISLAYDIYSLSTNSWKRLSNQPIYLGARGPGLAIVSPSTMDTFVNGVYYWIASLSTGDGTKDWILSFHLSTETFKLSDAPQGVVQPSLHLYNGSKWEIGLYKEFLALYVTQNLEQVGSIEIWVVTEFDNLGAPIAWQCLFVTSPIHVQYGPYAVGSRLDGDLLVKIADTLWVYDPRTSQCRDLSVKVGYCFSYVESLFPL
ncbi:F-box/kelch-repeat protein At3g23880-like [Chenopodium quinoa]|uniref:F-box/kelch-repeat protein At3g23880-like n=1 Tax=Chenopodium quinoa TaxID=63459 RepID=UPI000B78EE44|nr:F-box/kelch-repeat protein At3g23880-like [Chenopodium quinoa]XP_021749009.1 F-box/kelch-repeat protein At3g23880-like [Chenopodium quinoa]XP_021749010.1 F-box/kelch-repeat protein At3g23880-like [Chenopodium quinoa]